VVCDDVLKYRKGVDAAGALRSSLGGSFVRALCNGDPTGVYVPTKNDTRVRDHLRMCDDIKVDLKRVTQRLLAEGICILNDRQVEHRFSHLPLGARALQLPISGSSCYYEDLLRSISGNAAVVFLRHVQRQSL